MQVERLDGDVGAADCPLQQAPKVLKAIRVNAAIDVPFHVVHKFVRVLFRKSLINTGLIGVDFGAVLYLIQDSSLQRFAVHLRNYCSANGARFTI